MRAALKVTDPNLLYAAVFCENLCFSAGFCALQVLEFPGKVSAKIRVLCSVCHLRSP